MIRNPKKYPAPKLALAAMLTLAAAGALSPAEAERRRKQVAVVEPKVERTLPGAPVLAVGSIKDQRISLYDAEGNVLRSKISSGRTGYDTPVGVFAILEKNRDHRSNLYDAEMPFMQRLTWSGVALHEGQIPGYPASHGCVRLPGSFAEKIFPLTKVGLRVVLSKDDVAPVPFSHPLLLQPKPLSNTAVVTKIAYGDLTDERRSVFQPDLSNWPARKAELDQLIADVGPKMQAAEAAKIGVDDLKRAFDTAASARAKAFKANRFAENGKKAADDNLARIEKKLANAKQPSAIADWEKAKTKATFAVADAATKLADAAAKLKTADEALENAKKAWETADAARVAAEAAAVDAQHKTYPVSIFISRKAQRLYVRQGHEAVFDMPVAIADPDKPMGTHVFTAVDYKNEGNDLKWMEVSITRRSGSDIQTSALPGRKLRQEASAEPLPSDAAAAKAALDRITLPKEVVERFQASAWVGSSLIVSDEEAYKETGKATDFIVVMSDEPQGALKKRPKPAPPVFSPYGYFGDSGYTVTYGSRGQMIYRIKPQKPSTFGFW